MWEGPDPRWPGQNGWASTWASRGRAGCWWAGLLYRYRSRVGGAGGYRRCEGKNILGSLPSSSRPTADWRFHLVLMGNMPNGYHGNEYCRLKVNCQSRNNSDLAPHQSDDEFLIALQIMRKRS